MAVASSASKIGDGAIKDGGGVGGGSRKALDFYESMYHFKKMFPKLDSDVIEAILRANQGQVDKTLDQLLAITLDSELDEVQCEKKSENKQNDSGIIGEDSPPAYHEIVTSHVTVAASRIISDENYNSSGGASSISRSFINTTTTTTTGATNATPVSAITSASFFSNQDKNQSSSISSSSDLCALDEVRAIWRSRAMTGELRKDFLRIRLTNEQLRKFKASIKKAKRDEITAIVNNKVPENRSFELKNKMKEMTGQFDLSDDDSDSEQLDSLATSKYSENLMLTKPKTSTQIENDEYIAKMIQKEEEIKKSQEMTRRSSLIDDVEWKPKFTTDNQDISSQSFWFNNEDPASKAAKLGKPWLKTTSNKEETGSISSSSARSRPDEESDGEDDSYNIERIKWLEEFGSGLGAVNNPENRYKKAYKSFKKALKKKPLVANGLATIQRSLTKKTSNSDLLTIDQNNNNILNSYKDANTSVGASKSDLILFQDDYSYDNQSKINNNRFN